MNSIVFIDVEKYVSNPEIKRDECEWFYSPLKLFPVVPRIGETIHGKQYWEVIDVVYNITTNVIEVSTKLKDNQ